VIDDDSVQSASGHRDEDVCTKPSKIVSCILLVGLHTYQYSSTGYLLRVPAVTTSVVDGMGKEGRKEGRGRRAGKRDQLTFVEGSHSCVSQRPIRGSNGRLAFPRYCIFDRVPGTIPLTALFDDKTRIRSNDNPISDADATTNHNATKSAGSAFSWHRQLSATKRSFV
jgi:hypothetical protein